MRIISNLIALGLLGTAILISRWVAQSYPHDEILINTDFKTRFFARVFPFGTRWVPYVKPQSEKLMKEYTKRLFLSYIMLIFMLAISSIKHLLMGY